MVAAVSCHARHKFPQCFHVVKTRDWSLKLGLTERRPKSDPAAVMRGEGEGEGEDRENRRGIHRAGTTRREQQQWQLSSHETSETSEPLCSASH